MTASTAMTTSSVLDALAEVYDPELDEPITRLGFVTSCEVSADGDVQVVLQLPTPQCAPNFAFLMAADARTAVRRLPGVREVTIRLEDHYTGAEINSALSRGDGFTGAFPGETVDDDLAALRELFVRKALVGRESRLCEAMLADGLTPEEVAARRVEDLPDDAPDARRCLGPRVDHLERRVPDQRGQQRAHIWMLRLGHRHRRTRDATGRRDRLLRHDPAATPDDGGHLGDDGSGVEYVQQEEAAERKVDLLRQRQVFTRLSEGDDLRVLRGGSGHLVARQWIAVDRVDAAVPPHHLRQGHRHVAAARSHVHAPPTGAEPQTVQCRRQRPAVDVVAQPDELAHRRAPTACDTVMDQHSRSREEHGDPACHRA